MKNLLATVVTSAFATLLFNVSLTLLQDHRTTWQYDHWRAVYRAEQDRQARAAWLAAEFARTNKDPAWQWIGGGAVCVTNGVANSFVVFGNTAVSWSTGYLRFGINPQDGQTEYAPSFRPGDLELGFRRDGTVTFRKPPELEPRLTLKEASEQAKTRAVNAITNL